MKKKNKPPVFPEKCIDFLKKGRLKSADIITLLKQEGVDISNRQWRAYVRSFNDRHKERYIASNSQGYILTAKKKIIKKSIINKLRLGISMIQNARSDFKDLSEKDQLSLFNEAPDLQDLILKGKD